MHKQGAKGSLRKWLLHAFVVAPLLAVLALRVLDYNRFIQIPYWTVFSVCYLLPAANLSVCQMESIDAITSWTIAQWNWALEPVQPGTITPVPEIEAKDFSYELLDKLSHGFTIPVVARGLFADSPAVTKWSHDFFAEKYGENILITLTEARTDVQYEQAGLAREVAASGSNYQNIMRPVKMKVKSALRRMKEGEKLYISNVDTIFRRNNELIADLQFSRIRPWAYTPYSPTAAQMFLGYGSADATNTTGTMYHCASSANLFIQAQGAKDWLFILPRYTIFTHPSLGMMMPAAKASTNPMNVPKMSTHLRAGDVLLNPPWMWHETRNREGLSVGVATRENHPAWILRNNWLFSFLAEFRVTPQVAKNFIPADRTALRLVSAVPFLTFSMILLAESVRGIGPSAVFTATFNPCDEHDPTSCSSSLLDRAIYSDGILDIPFQE